jgi:phosphatidylserine decarboxylase
MKKACTKIVVGIHGFFLFLIGQAPVRKIPSENVVVSPAHGKVIEVRRVENSEIIFEKKGVQNHVIIPEILFPATLIVIEMTPLDVHVQRAPIAGTVMRLDHYRGKHKNAMGHDMENIVEENEKVIALFANENEKVVSIQVAGRAARRIRNVVEVGSEIEKGDIYGRILFGSQVVVIVPIMRTVSVNVGDRVVDGETVLAR